MTISLFIRTAKIRKYPQPPKGGVPDYRVQVARVAVAGY
jgi:hypothetical protein